MVFGMMFDRLLGWFSIDVGMVFDRFWGTFLVMFERFLEDCWWILDAC